MPVYYLNQETEGQRSGKIPALIGGLITLLILAVATAIIAYYVTRPDDAVLASSNAAEAPQTTVVEPPDATETPQSTVVAPPDATETPEPPVVAPPDAAETPEPPVAEPPDAAETPEPPVVAPSDIGAAFASTVKADTNTIYLVDTSNSMRSDLDKVQTSLNSLAGREDFSSSRIRLMTFDAEVGTALDFDFMESPGSRAGFRKAVNSLKTAAPRPGFNTMMYLGIQRAHDELVKLADYDRPNLIVVFTDGASDDYYSHYGPLLKEVLNSPIPDLRIDIIGYGLDPTITYFPNEVMEELSGASGTGASGRGGDDPTEWTEAESQFIQRKYGMSQDEFFDFYGTPILEPILKLTTDADGTYRPVERVDP